MSTTDRELHWRPDILGPSYRQLPLALGNDPDGDGPIEAVLVRHEASVTAGPRAVVLWVHGFSDYFFHTHVAERFAAEGLAVYGLDLRKCGRSLRFGQYAHYVTDLAYYDRELDAALAVIEQETEAPVVVMAHSTGGLIAPLWLRRRIDRDGVSPVAGLVLNSPWLQLDVGGVTSLPPERVLPAVDRLLGLLSRVRPTGLLPLPTSDLYGTTLWSQRTGEFDFHPGLKPMGGSGVRPGWLRAVRIGQQRLQAGLELDLPVLLLRSTASAPRGPRRDIDTDLVLDVASMRRFAPAIGPRVRDVPIRGARHDVMLSRPQVREQAVAEFLSWLDGEALA